MDCFHAFFSADLECDLGLAVVLDVSLGIGAAAVAVVGVGAVLEVAVLEDRDPPSVVDPRVDLTLEGMNFALREGVTSTTAMKIPTSTTTPTTTTGATIFVMLRSLAALEEIGTESGV
jgi:hypothetical protein